MTALDDVRQHLRRSASGLIGRRRADGTMVFVLYGRDEASLRTAVESFPPAGR